MCFTWGGNGFQDVEIVGRHYGVAMQHEPLSIIHPGEILLEEFMQPPGISQNRLARDARPLPESA